MDEQNTVQNQSADDKKGYGKRPLWQWIVIYVVIAGVIYLIIYYFFLRGGISLPGY